MLSKKNIVLIDSGIGGLTTLQFVARYFTNLNITYIADRFYYPYTDKAESDLKQRLLDLITFVNRHFHPDLIIIACNTAATLLLPELEYPYVASCNAVPIIGVVPAIKQAAQRTQTKKIGLLATPATLVRTVTQQLIHKVQTEQAVTIITSGSTDLIEIAEQKVTQAMAPDLHKVTHIIKPLLVQDIDIVVLACTHFPWLTDTFITIATQYQQHIEWLDSSQIVIQALQQHIPQHYQHHHMKQQHITYNSFLFTAGKQKTAQTSTQTDPFTPGQYLTDYLAHTGFKKWRTLYI